MENTPKTIQEVVAEKITTIGKNIADTVAENLAQSEISKRVELVTKAIAKQDQLEKDIKKIDKDDVTTYVGDTPHTSRSKNRYYEVKKAKEKFEKLTKDINDALNGNTTEAYAKLTETLKKLENAGGGQKEGSGNSE